MDITDYIVDSFQEYEGHHSLVLFCRGCNLKCCECYNLEAVTSENITGTAIDLMDNLITPIHDAVVFLGGEPTVWDIKLMDALDYAMSHGYKTKIYTNGMKPDLIATLNDLGLVSAYSVDYKCIRDCKGTIGVEMPIEDYEVKVTRTIMDILENKLELEIRTTKWDVTLDQIPEIQELVAKRFPGVRHIIQDKFEVKDRTCLMH